MARTGISIADRPVLAPARPVGRSDAGELLDVDAFGVGEWRFATAAGAAVEVLDAPPAFRLPRSRRWLSGAINVHGAPVPLFDPAVLIGVRVVAQRKVMVFDAAGVRAGLLVDGLPRRLRLAPLPVPRLPDLPPEVTGAVVGRLASEPPWILLDMPTLLANLGRSARL